MLAYWLPVRCRRSVYILLWMVEMYPMRALIGWNVSNERLCFVLELSAPWTRRGPVRSISRPEKIALSAGNKKLIIYQDLPKINKLKRVCSDNSTW